MRTAAIKLRGAVGVAWSLPRQTRAQILHVILASFGMLAIIYLFILGMMVWNIIDRKALEVEVHKLASEVRLLEETYLAEASQVDLNFSHSQGFKEIKATFVPRKTLGSLGAPNNEI